jgi:hypothetical protein
LWGGCRPLIGIISQKLGRVSRAILAKPVELTLPA